MWKEEKYRVFVTKYNCCMNVDFCSSLYNKTLNVYSLGKQLVLFSLESHIETLGKKSKLFPSGADIIDIIISFILMRQTDDPSNLSLNIELIQKSVQEKHFRLSNPTFELNLLYFSFLLVGSCLQWCLQDQSCNNNIFRWRNVRRSCVRNIVG